MMGHYFFRMLLLLMATVAGASGLMAQIVWTRFAIQFFGVSATTIAIVLAIALSGLSLGALWAGGWVGRKKNAPQRPLFLASLLLIVASLSILVAAATANGMSGSLATVLGVQTNDQSLVLVLKQLLVVSVALGPLNFVLGAILPTLVAAHRCSSGAIVGQLYAAETLGGCAGAIATGFWLIQAWGLTFTLLITAGVSGVAGLLGLVVAQKSSPTADETDSQGQSRGALQDWPVMVAVLLAGGASLGLEVVWQRLLVLVVGTDTHSYTIVSVGYLGGLSFGAALATAWLRMGKSRPARSRTAFSWLQLLVALVNVGVLAAFFHLASGPGQVWLSEPLLGQPRPLLKRFLLCAGVLIVPTTIIGACFPIAVDALRVAQKTLAARTGMLYSCAALGNVLGVLLSGFVLIPLLGLQTSVIVCGFLSVFAGLVNLIHVPYSVATHSDKGTEDSNVESSKDASDYQQAQKSDRSKKTRKSNLVGGDESLSETMVGKFWLVASGVLVVAVGGYQIAQQQPVGLAWEKSTTELTWYREGPANTVAVLTDRENPNFRRLVVDGIVVGQSGKGVEEKQQLLAHLPFVLIQCQPKSADNEYGHQSPRRFKALTIGLGTGLLAGQVASLEQVEQVTAVELSPAVIEASNYFADLCPKRESAIKPTIVQGDGVQLLRTSSENFDVIISDGKSRPGHAGNVAFFSRDYYRLAAQRLDAGGVFVQWFSLEGSTGELQVVLKSFADMFDHGYVAIAAPDSVYLVGSAEPIELDPTLVDQYLQSPATGVLNRYYWRSADDLRSMGWLSAADVAAALPAEVELNTLERPVLERFALEIHRQARAGNKLNNLNLLKSLVSQATIGDELFLSDDNVAPDDLQQGIFHLIESARLKVAAEKNWLDNAAGKAIDAFEVLPKHNRGGDLAELYLQATAEFRRGNDVAGQLSSLTRASKLLPNDAAMQVTVANELARLGQHERATPLFYRAAKLEPDNADYHVSFAISLIRLQKPRSAIRPLNQAINLDPKHARAYFGLGLTSLALGDRARAQTYFQAAIQLDPKLADQIPAENR